MISFSYLFYIVVVVSLKYKIALGLVVASPFPKFDQLKQKLRFNCYQIFRIGRDAEPFSRARPSATYESGLVPSPDHPITPCCGRC